MTRRLLSGIGRLVTAGTPAAIDDAAVVLDGSSIAWAGPASELDRGLSFDEEVDLGGALVTPGLVDAHTHPVYAGDRFEEIAMRSAGASYGELAAAGGGIASTVAATRAAPLETLGGAVRARLAAFLAGGTTTVEAKTGYHLDKEGELAATKLLVAMADGEGLPSVEVTFLAGHAVGPEWGDDLDGYVAEIATWSTAARRAGARHVDVFCDEGYFSPAEARRVLTAGQEAGLLPRIHADELARTGGSELAAELGCVSADHLLRIEERDAVALRSAGVVATLAPVTALAMGRRPPVEALRRAGVTIALGSDHNPGTCGTTSMSLVVALAVSELGLSVSEAVTAATAGGARSLALADRGRVAAGLRADLVAWDADHEGAFAWAYGLRPVAVWCRGERRR